MLFTSNSWGKNIDILQRTMDVAVLRREVIANNVANAETPQFKRTTVNFEAQLKRVLDQEQHEIKPEARMTDPRHMSFNISSDYRDILPKRVLDYTTSTKQNGNNVDMEEELMASNQNQLLYQTMAQAVSSEFNMVNLVLR